MPQRDAVMSARGSPGFFSLILRIPEGSKEEKRTWSSIAALRHGLEGPVRQVDEAMPVQTSCFQFRVSIRILSRARLQDFPKGRYLLPGVGRTEPGTRIELFQLFECVIRHLSRAVCRPLQGIVMKDNHSSVPGETDIHLDHVAAGLDRLFEGGEGILPEQPLKTPGGQ